MKDNEYSTTTFCSDPRWWDGYEEGQKVQRRRDLYEMIFLSIYCIYIGIFIGTCF